MYGFQLGTMGINIHQPFLNVTYGIPNPESEELIFSLPFGFLSFL